MEYQIFMSKLKEKGYQPQIFGHSDNVCDMINVRIFDPMRPHFESSSLYLTSTDSMPAANTNAEFTLMCFGERLDFSIYQQSRFTILYFGTSFSQAALFNTAMELLTEIQQITAGMHLLLNASFSGKGLQYLVDTASRIFGNPIYVVDLQNKYLAISAGIVPDNDFFREESKSGYISKQGIASIRANHLDEMVRKYNRPYYYTSELVHTGMLVDAIHIQNIEVGHVMMLESEHPFEDYAPDFFHRFCKLVSLELQKDPAYTRNKGVMYSYFLVDLLRNPQNNIENLKERLEVLGYNLKSSFYIIAIPSFAQSSSHLQLEVILEHLKRIFSGSIYVIYEDTIVFLINKDLYQGFSEYELSQLKEYLSANNLKAGISNFYQNLEDTSRFYQQAIDAINLGLKLNTSNPLCYYSDYYVYKMLEVFEKEDTEIRFLIHPGLMNLYLYDQEKETDFLKTLQEYLKHPGQSSLVAKNLHIHKNTLLYRMGKIKELIGSDLTQGDDYMNMNLSLMIMKYLNML